MRVVRELQDHMMILVLCRIGMLNSFPIFLQAEQGVIPNLTPKSSSTATFFINGKEKVVPRLDHLFQDHLGNRIIGIDEHVKSLEPIEFKGKVDHFIGAGSENCMSKIETQIRCAWGNHWLWSQGDKSIVLLLNFHYSQSTAGFLRFNEFCHEGTIDGQGG